MPRDQTEVLAVVQGARLANDNDTDQDGCREGIEKQTDLTYLRAGVSM